METILIVSLWALINAQKFMATTTLIAPETVKSASGQELIENWILDLRQCESGGNDKALNPKDTNNLRSVGRFQFQDKTFSWLSKKYDIKTTSIWNGDEQEQILRRMIVDPDINIKNQFPDCIKNHIGMPPMNEL